MRRRQRQESNNPPTQGKGRGCPGVSAIKRLLKLRRMYIVEAKPGGDVFSRVKTKQNKTKMLVTRGSQSVPSLPSWSCLGNLLSSGSGPSRKPIPKGPLAGAPDLAEGLSVSGQCLAKLQLYPRPSSGVSSFPGCLDVESMVWDVLGGVQWSSVTTDFHSPALIYNWHKVRFRKVI